MFGLPLPVVMLATGLLAGAASPFLVAGYHKLCLVVFAKTGVELPDNAEVEADIPKVVKALAPLVAEAVYTGRLDAPAMLKAVENAVAAAGGTDAHVAQVAPALADLHPDKFGVPGLR